MSAGMRGSRRQLEADGGEGLGGVLGGGQGGFVWEWGVVGGFGEIGPAGGADSAEGRRAFFNFQPQPPPPPCASNHSPDNPRRLITIATHLLPDIALSVSDTRTQVRINRPLLGCCLYHSMAKLWILVFFFFPPLPTPPPPL